MPIPAAVARTLNRALTASASLATSPYFADLPQARRDAAEIRSALEWVEQQQEPTQPTINFADRRESCPN